MSHTLLSERQWNELFRRLEGPEGCDFKYPPGVDPESEDAVGKLTWRCKGGMDKTYASKILTEMRITGTLADSVLRYVESLGGHCDCEILFNAVERVYEHIDEDALRTATE